MNKLELQNRLNQIDARTVTKNFVKETVTSRYPHTDKALRNDPNLEVLHQAFSYVRGIPIYFKDGSLDHEFAHQMMTSPSASIQVLDKARINSSSKILEIFSGFGYLTIFLALTKPEQLICGDLFTPTVYDLPTTFNKALEYIYEKNIPTCTQPEWVQLDGTRPLPFPNLSFDNILLSPPFGRGSQQLFPAIGEDKAKDIWLMSIEHSKRLLKDSNSTIISTVPLEWTNSLNLIPILETVHEIIPLKNTQRFPIGMVITKLFK